MLWRNLELQCRDIFKEAVCVWFLYIIVEGLASIPIIFKPVSIHGVGVYIENPQRPKKFGNLFVKLPLCYNWLRVMRYFHILIFLGSGLDVLDICIPDICSVLGLEGTEEEECWREYCSTLSCLLSWPTLRCKLGLAGSLNNCNSPSTERGETEHISNIQPDTQWSIARLGLLEWFALGNLGSEFFVAFHLAGRKVFNRLWSRITVLSCCWQLELVLWQT